MTEGPRRHVDKSLAQDDDCLPDFDEGDGEEDPREPPPWQDPSHLPHSSHPPHPSHQSHQSHPSQDPEPPRSHPCWSCAAAVPAGSPSCPECQESTRHLRLIGPGSSIDLRHGEGPPLRLGRHPVWATAVAVALSGDKGKGVSRRHAELQLMPDGTMWLTECAHGTTNGTYVDDERIAPGARVPVTDGNVIGLGRNCAFTVLLVEPDA
ncbi:FHA domain-containing protein [Streptomyces sp. T028]|uniref:FHA domain-containing protein n=1 Tax=Streptomyces sp. T028 TaxID=3394379 RepID=UPI003A8753E3